MKKFLITMMCVAMVIAMMPAMAFAEGEVINSTAELQAAIDKATEGSTIRLAPGVNYGTIYVRPTANNETVMKCKTHGYTTGNATDFKAHMTNKDWHTTPIYTTTFRDVTIVGAEGATIAGFVATSGHAYGDVYDYVRDIDYTEGSAYYNTLNISNLTFQEVAFTGKIDINTSDADSVYDGVTFEKCSFTTGGTAASNGAAIRYYNENNNGNVKNINVTECEFNNCYQGVYVHHVNGVKVTGCKFDTTGHNAIAMQGHDGSVNLKAVVITGNNFNKIGDRVIRFNEIGADSNITIQDNTAVDSGDGKGEVMKATSIAKGVTTSIRNNSWGEGKVVVNNELKDFKINADTLQTALNAGGTVVLDDNITLADKPITVNAGTIVTLDLNGKNLSGTSSASTTSYLIKVESGADLTIINGTVEFEAGKPDTDWGEGKERPFPGYANNTINNSGKLTVENTTIVNKTAPGGASYAIDNYPGADLFINSGTVNGSGKTAIRMFANSDTIATNVTVNGGTITGSRGIWIQLPGSNAESKKIANLTVTGGTITNTNTNDLAIYSYSYGDSFTKTKVTITGGIFNGDIGFGGGHKGDTENVSVTGGTFNGTYGVFSYGKMKPFITGGTFTTNPKAYVKSGNVYKYNNGTYKVAATAPNNTKDYVWSASPNADGIYTESYVAPYIPSTPTTPTDNVTNSGTAGTDNATTSADLSGSTSTSNGTTTATVDKTTADKIVDKAVENKSTEVVIDATANSTAAADSTTTAQVTIPTETLGAIAEKTEADVTIKTDVAEVKMDNAAAAAVSEQAEGDTVKIIAEKVKEDATEVHFELKVVCSDGKVISDFKGGNIAVTVALPKAMAEKKVVCVYIDDNGHMSKVEGQKNADGTYTFFTGHFSTYAIMAEEEADAAIAAQTEAIKNIKIKLTSKQVKTKSGKKGIKITWTAAAGDKVLDGVEVFRSKEKNKGYGTKAFFTSTKGGNKGSYINTKSLKKGTRYYYKVRGYVLVNGEKVYTDYSTKAWRTVK